MRPHYAEEYERFVDLLLVDNNEDCAMSLAVGGDYEYIGSLERDLLIGAGLPANGFLIDVGCGSGRTAYALRDLSLRYLGTDVVQRMLDYATTKCARPDWTFAQTNGLMIPAQDGVADMVAFFSVLTHLRHEESWLYLVEALRVLRPGGRIVFSFLDFGVPAHWTVFEDAISRARSPHPTTTFIDPIAIRTWAEHLDCDVLRLEVSSIGQSLAVLQKNAT